MYKLRALVGLCNDEKYYNKMQIDLSLTWFKFAELNEIFKFKREQ